ncbi:MAG: 8-amino-7-oxononanoate synthase, partial [Actinomycetes bacterium]
VRRRAGQLAGIAALTGREVPPPGAAVVSVLIGEPGRAAAAAAALLERGVRVGCFRPPSVPDGVSRLRLTARADLTDGDLQTLRSALAQPPDLGAAAPSPAPR